MNTLYSIGVLRTGQLAHALKDLFIDATTERWITDAVVRWQRILICGCGGSHADAIHFAEELTGRYKGHKIAYPAFALGTNPGHLTCVANDYGFEHVFQRELEAHTRVGYPSDNLLIAMTTSGTTSAIHRVVEFAAEKGIRCLVLTGIGGKARWGANSPRESQLIHFIEAGDTPATTQEIHMHLLHTICEFITERLPDGD